MFVPPPNADYLGFKATARASSRRLVGRGTGFDAVFVMITSSSMGPSGRHLVGQYLRSIDSPILCRGMHEAYPPRDFRAHHAVSQSCGHG